MINPGLITLAKARSGKLHAVIEDNIGESIHFHYRDIRVDMTVDEFIQTANVLLEAASILLGPISDELLAFDSDFLNASSMTLLDLDHIESGEVFLNDIVCHSPKYGWTRLNHSMAYDALTGKNDSYYSSNQALPPFVNNRQRLESVFNYVKGGGVGTIVIDGDSNVILDGQHRASCMLYLYGNRKIPCVRFFYKTKGLKPAKTRRFKRLVVSTLRRMYHIFGR